MKPQVLGLSASAQNEGKQNRIFRTTKCTVLDIEDGSSSDFNLNNAPGGTDIVEMGMEGKDPSGTLLSGMESPGGVQAFR